MKRRFAPPSRDLLHREQFQHEPVYCESPHNPDDDVLYSGSDDDDYDSPVERQLRIEHQANRFLHGLPMFIASASFQGPFNKESGWQNPWRSRSIPASRSANRLRLCPPHPHGITTTGLSRHRKPKPAPVRNNRYLPSPEVANEPPSEPGHEYLDSESLSRVSNWRDGVVPEVMLDTGRHKTPAAPEPAPTQASRLSIDRSQGKTLIQIVADSFEASRAAKFSSQENMESFLDATSLDAQLPVYEPQAEQAVSSLPNYTNPAATPARQSLQLVQLPANAQLSHPTVEEPQSSELSDPPKSSPGAEEPAPAEEEHDNPSIIVKAKECSPVSPAKALSEARSQERSDRSFHFRAPRCAPAPIRYQQHRAQISSQRESNEGGQNLERPPVPQQTAQSMSSQSQSRDDAKPVMVGHNEALEPSQESISGEIQPAVADGIPGGTAPGKERDGYSDDDQDYSMIDGPTLIPSTVSSELSDAQSMDNFSPEKHLQNLSQKMTPLPRKLLWPKSNKDTASTSLDSESSTSWDGIHKTKPEIVVSLDTAAEQAVSAFFYVSQQAASDQTVQNQPDSCSKQTDAQKEANSEQHSGTSLGTPIIECHGEPSSPSPEAVTSPIDQIANMIKIEAPDDDAEHVSPFSARRSCGKLSDAQSSWVKEPILPVPTLDAPQEPSALGTPGEPTPDTNQVSQSPWAKGDSQLAVVPITGARIFNPISSPAHSLQPLQEITIPNLAPPQSPCDRDTEMSGKPEDDCPLVPSTPEMQQSSLPTPEYTHSIRSFREFMTPSPQKPRPAKKRRISENDGHLPNTHHLVDTAVSNPWLQSSQSPPRKKKQHRVSWAPLPTEEDEASITVAQDQQAESPPGAELTETPSTTRWRPTPILRRARCTSPPPSALNQTLPAEQKRFTKHFAAVASRQSRAHVALLPSASQKSSGSTQIGAMAERFIAADDLSSRPWAISVLSENVEREQLGSQSVGDTTGSQRRTSMLSMGQSYGLNDTGAIFQLDGQCDFDPTAESQEDELDPVSDLLQNLDSILENTWDIDDSGQIGQPGAGENSNSGSKRKRSSYSSSARRSGGAGHYSSSGTPVTWGGVMDAGVSGSST